MSAPARLLTMSLFLCLSLLTPASARTITVLNACSSTIWPGLHTGGGSSPSQATGWELAAGASTSFDVADDWTAGRVWARTGCATADDGTFACLTGGCDSGAGGEVTCSTTDQPPATLAEFTLSSSGADNYDISLVDGFNIPLSIAPSDSACEAPACAADINALCPAILRTAIDASGVNYGCAHACNAGFGEETYGNRACCSGGYAAEPALCEACGVDYYDVFKDNCNTSYAYAYDEKSGTALWTCESGPDYTITFCPSSSSYAGSSDAAVPDTYAAATATCSSMVTSFSVTYAVSASPTAAQTTGTLDVVATNAAGVGGQAALALGGGGSSLSADTSTSAGTGTGAASASGKTSTGASASFHVAVETDVVTATSTMSASVAATTAAMSSGGRSDGGGNIDLADTGATKSGTCKGGAMLTPVPGRRKRGHAAHKEGAKRGRRH
ncbi:hypothetical protein Q5752_007043 [Cryptotrichosporon argae]